MKKVVSLVLVLVLAALAVVACGDDDGTTTTTSEQGAAAEGGAAAGGGEAAGGGGGVAETLKFEADPGGALAYTSDEESVKAGQVTIEFTNPQSVPHDVAIESPDGEEVGKTDIVADGTASTTLTLKPGKDTFYCTVPGHREAGMEGTLNVE